MTHARVFRIREIQRPVMPAQDPVVYAKLRRTSLDVIAANINKNGRNFADIRLTQECAELIQAITNKQLDIPEKANVNEELADVLYMIDVYCRVNNVSYDELNQRMAQKEAKAIKKLGLTVDRPETGWGHGCYD